MSVPVLLSANDITIRLRDHFLFHNTFWKLHEGQQWLIVGPNGSGKTTFAKALAGLLPLKTGEIILHFVEGEFPYPQLHKDQIAYVSFDTQQQFLKMDSLRRDFESYVGMETPGAKVKDFLPAIYSISSFKEKFSVDHLWEREIATLSTGEMRKVFLLKAILQNPKILILDEPFDGLDEESKSLLTDMIDVVITTGTHVILIVHRLDQIPQAITHVMIVENGKIQEAGKKEDELSRYSHLYTGIQENQLTGEMVDQSDQKQEVLIAMRNVTVKYGDKIILDDISWQLRDGQNWAILGHNGAGKSTMLQLVMGDNQQRYANNITIFGKKKDEGISVWDIKQAMGIVSQDVMLAHSDEMRAFSVILSGFFDSIGLYKTASYEQREITLKLIKDLGLEEIAQKDYQQLSFGQKRLILIARAVVKNPKILILDEPCHGLDRINRQKILDIIDRIGNTATNLLLVTHNPDEIVPSITHVLELESGKMKKQIKL